MLPDTSSFDRSRLLDYHKAMCQSAWDLMDKKNQDYAGGHGRSPFANFERVEAMGITTVEKGFLVRMTDKMSRLSSFLESGEFKVKDESFEDTLVDLINYSVLLSAYRAAKRGSVADAVIAKESSSQKMSAL